MSLRMLRRMSVTSLSGLRLSCVADVALCLTLVTERASVVVMVKVNKHAKGVSQVKWGARK